MSANVWSHATLSALLLYLTLSISVDAQADAFKGKTHLS